MKHIHDSFYKYDIINCIYGKWCVIEIIDNIAVSVSFGDTKKEAGQNLKNRRKFKRGNVMNLIDKAMQSSKERDQIELIIKKNIDQQYRSRFVDLLNIRCKDILKLDNSPIVNSNIVPLENKPYCVEIDGMLFTLVK